MENEINDDQNTKKNQNIIDHSKITDLKTKYQHIKLLGNGSFGKVRLFKDKTCTDMKYAIKTLNKEMITKDLINFIKQEIKILQDLDHPNIVKYFETYEDELFIHIVMEYIPGDDLFRVISQKKLNIYSEKNICELIEQLLKAIMFLHNKNIVHRDLKPENILFSNPGNHTTLKLIDFGLATTQTGKTKYRVGSPYYMSPESIEGNSVLKSDMWSIGVILYTILTGKRPFESNSQTEVFRLIKSGKYSTTLLDEQKISNEAKDLTKKLLVVDIHERLSAEEALNHPWIKKLNENMTQTWINNEIVESLKMFSEANLLEKETLFYLAKISSDEEVYKLKKAFLEVDKDNTGTIEYEEILEAFKIAGIKPKEVIIIKIREKLKEFLIALISTMMGQSIIVSF